MDDKILVEVGAKNEFVKHPLEIFPVEAWEVILDHLDDVDDIRNALQAWPQLEILSNGKQFSWFISQVMPIFFSKYLDVKDIKSCRLASKRWKKAVDICIETHQDYTPYKSGAMSETHFNYHSCRIITNMSTFVRVGYSKEMGYLNGNHNPFPGRNVFMFVEDETWQDDPCWRDHFRRYQFTLQLSKAMPTMQIFGHHIWHITVSLPYISYTKEESVIRRVLQPLFQCLSWLPNLKSLNIMALSLPPCDIHEETIKEISKSITLPFRLEAVDLRLWQTGTGDKNFVKNLHPTFMTAFINPHYLRKLTFQSIFWRSEYISLVPNITELSMRVSNIPKMCKVLEDLQYSPLRKLHIEVLMNKLFVGEILETLSPYQNIEYLQLGGDALASSVSRVPEYELTSIKHLRMGIDKLLRGFDFLFLEALPNLEYLTIEAKRMVSSMESIYENRGADEDEDPFLASLHNLFQHKQHGPENFIFVWNLLPELKMLTIRDINDTYQYTREFQKTVYRTACPPH